MLINWPEQVKNAVFTLRADLFKTIIPLILLKEDFTVNDTANDTVNDTVNQLIGNQASTTLKQRLIKIIDVINKNPRLRSNIIANKVDIDIRNIRRDLKKLQDLGLIQFIGTPKTGGYFIAEEFQDKFKE